MILKCNFSSYSIYMLIQMFLFSYLAVCLLLLSAVFYFFAFTEEETNQATEILS